MLDCSACTRRAIRAIAGDALTSTSQPRLLLTPHLTRRRQSTATHASSPSGAPYLNAAQLRHEQKTSSDPFVPLIRKHESLDTDPTVSSDKRAIASQDRAIRKELQWLADPAKLAEHVHYTLRCDNPDKALEICRMASNKMQCVVSWNHCLDWHMKQGRVQDAVRIYNDMKKRAQFPDAYTYTLLLRGLVGLQGKDKRAKVLEEHVSKAVSLYTSMSAPTSRVQPTIIHTNAALKVCAFGHDMDALWGIAGKIPDHGAGAADHVTYSIILNALRHEIQRMAFDAGPAAATAQREKSVNEGRRVWMEVIAKWRSGQVKLDEELVCAMARLLLVSQRLPDWDDVLSLVQQTMQIERLVAPYGSLERQTGHVPQLASAEETPTALTSAEEREHDGFVDTPAAKAFKPVTPMPADPAKPRRPTALTHVTPGNATLSVLIEACTLMRTPKTASAYWALLTTEYAIKPDVHNFNAQLRLLHKNRASAQAARLIKDDLPASGVVPMNLTFRIAMDACARDHKNASALEHVMAIISVMESTLPDPDVETLKKYLSLAMTTDSGPMVVAALDRLDSLVHNLRSRVLYGRAEGKLTPQQEVRERSEALGFMKLMVGAVDTLMDRGLVGREDYRHWHARRSQLTKFIGRGDGSVEGSRAKLAAQGKMAASQGEVRSEAFMRMGRARKGEVMGAIRKTDIKFTGGQELRTFRGQGERWEGDRRKASDEGGKSGGPRRRATAREEEDGFAASPADLGM